ncbi:hypothetical protein ACIBVL_27235 [Streptomyces sp. NPDC049687]|uniref:acyl-CoA-like ligand-binding transcription factor n=1 Tax=Streptomyces sp. NPDC049687 TaxID=3365596 RepID=UPI00378E0010
MPPRRSPARSWAGWPTCTGSRGSVPWHRQRMELILTVPTLQAGATLRFPAWRRIITDFAAVRTGLPASAMPPRLVGHAALGAALSAHETWLADPDADLSVLLDAAVGRLARGFGALATNA